MDSFSSETLQKIPEKDFPSINGWIWNSKNVRHTPTSRTNQKPAAFFKMPQANCDPFLEQFIARQVNEHK